MPMARDFLSQYKMEKKIKGYNSKFAFKRYNSTFVITSVTVTNY